MLFDAKDLINLERYPIHAVCKQRVELIEQMRAKLDFDGCAVLKGFLSEKGIQALKDEAGSVLSLIHI